jgi:hypothetical protein
MLTTHRIACLAFSAALVISFLPGCGSGNDQADQVTADATAGAHGSKGTERQDPAPKMRYPKLEKKLCPRSRILVRAGDPIRFSTSCRARDTGMASFILTRIGPRASRYPLGIRKVQAWARDDRGSRVPKQCRLTEEVAGCEVRTKRPFHLRGAVWVDSPAKCGMAVALAIVPQHCVPTGKAQACEAGFDLDYLAVKRAPAC